MTRSRQALIRSVGQATQAYQRSFDALDDAAAERMAINRTDLRCLDWLWGGPMSVGRLSESIGLSSAATTTLLDRLEQKDFVRRTRDAGDRRKVLVEMTDFGRRLTSEVYEPIARDGASLLRTFSDEQLEAITSYLDAARELTEQHRLRLRDTTA
jgi:DNA-binding MarR family transcriptional regulator